MNENEMYRWITYEPYVDVKEEKREEPSRCARCRCVCYHEDFVSPCQLCEELTCRDCIMDDFMDAKLNYKYCVTCAEKAIRILIRRKQKKEEGVREINAMFTDALFL